jgi:hypothetical protein
MQGLTFCFAIHLASIPSEPIALAPYVRSERGEEVGAKDQCCGAVKLTRHVMRVNFNKS